MWEKLKNAITGAQEALGIEIPELPVDLSALGEAATGAVEGLTGVTETAAAGSADVLGATSDALPDVPGAIADTSASK